MDEALGVYIACYLCFLIGFAGGAVVTLIIVARQQSPPRDPQ